MKNCHFRIVGMIDRARPSEGTVTINRARLLFTVRPLRRRKAYELPLYKVAEIVVWKVAAAEARELRAAKAAARKARRRA